MVGTVPAHNGETVPRPPDDDAPTGAEAKPHLRSRSRAARRALPAAGRRHAEHAIHAALAGLPELAGGGPVLAYAASAHEVDLDPWLRVLLARGRPLRLPRVAGADLEVVAVGDLDRDLVPGWRRLREPCGGDLGTDGLAVAVVPGVAFDAGGGRLGQGGGHVDRLLSRIDRTRTTVVGVGFAVQLVDAVPREAHDAMMDVVVTEQGAYRAG